MDELREFGSHFSTQDNTRFTLRMLIPPRHFAVRLTRHQLADGAPWVNVDTGLHPPYASLASPLESKHHVQNPPTTSPTLVGMLIGLWCLHGVSFTQGHDSMSICSDVLYRIRAQLLLCIALRQEAWRVADFHQYHQNDQSTKMCYC